MAFFNFKSCTGLASLGLGCFVLLPAPALAQTTFDVIGPHEYELPTDYEPFNAFVQYAYVQDNDKVRDGDGDKVDGSGTQQIVGLSKYVRFWTPSFNRKIGMAYEVIVPEIGVRDSANNRHSGGLGDPITGFAIWYNPTKGSTLGFQSFIQIPVGSSDVSDQTWKNLSSLLWHVPFSSKLSWSGDGGTVYQSTNTSTGLKPGLSFHTNNRIGYRALHWLEPFIGLDYQNTKAKDGVPKAYTFDGGAGLMFHMFDNQSLTFRYSTSLEGENYSQNNSFNVKYAYVW